MIDHDVIVAGAGPAGLAAACLLALDGANVALVARQQGDASDPRTVALMQPSIRMLLHLGIWPGELKSATQALRKLRMVDDTGSMFTAPTLTFDPTELGEEVFGWNFPLGLLIPALFARAQELGVAHIGADVVSASAFADHVSVTTTSGERISARVAIAADGRNSVLREAAGIGTNKWSYDQSALPPVSTTTARMTASRRSITGVPGPSPPYRCQASARASFGWSARRGRLN